MPAMAAPGETRPKMATTKDDTRFLGSQIGGSSAINFSYTDMPWRLMAGDLFHFFQNLWALPYLVWPVTPDDSEELCELSPTRANGFCLAVHLVLCILQLAFLAAFPVLALLPIWTAAAAVAVFMLVNAGICRLLNGDQVEYQSDAKYAPARPEHAHEQWIYINGVAAGEHWMKSNLNRLAVTFKRPILGVHNKTAGIIFDVIECLIQRNWGYATRDVRVCYRIIKEKLYNPQYSKVIFILHSQGAIEGSLILDWLLEELPQDLLAKLEIYTFGNAANHFNNPHRHLSSQKLAKRHPLAASVDTTRLADGNCNDNPTQPSSSPRSSLSTLLTPPTTTAASPSALSGLALGHIEHYAHTTDPVAIWGVLRFAEAAGAGPTVPRFMGRVFVRACAARGGHQLVQHYLDDMFPLRRDPRTGRLLRDGRGVPVGVVEEERGDGFMEEVVVLGVARGAAAGREREGDGEDDGEVEVIGLSPVVERDGGGFDVVGDVRVKVKQLSRLWQYRNGRSPQEKPPLLVRDAHGVLRNATM